MESNQSSYRQIFKATSLFGGVQVFNIVISIIRSKIIAILLGPTGIGIAGLFTSTTGLISGITNFGLGTSAVRDIATANESNNVERISKVIYVFKRLVWLTGILGLILTLIFAPWLSQITFGNKKYTIAFIWLSIILLLNQLSSGQSVILQGMRKLKYLAQANIAGSIIGLLISVPIYYVWHIDGIVPAIILTSLASLAIAWFFASKIKIQQTNITWKETIIEGKGMLRMGFVLSLSGLITILGSYIVRIYISNKGGLSDVGLYGAGFAVISTYVGLVFSAMTTDYYPRLSAISHENTAAAQLINQQAETAILIISPILTIFLIFINFIVTILYSSKFISIAGMIHWAALGMYFKTASWSISYIFPAKGESKIFFWSEIVANFYMLILNIAGYTYFGLDGLGISFLLNYIIYYIQVHTIAKLKYNFEFMVDFKLIFVFQLLLGILCFLNIKFIPSPFTYFSGIILVIMSIWFSFKELKKRIGYKNLLGNYFK